jgi:hypothetical protein
MPFYERDSLNDHSLVNDVFVRDKVDAFSSSMRAGNVQGAFEAGSAQ